MNLMELRPYSLFPPPSLWSLEVQQASPHEDPRTRRGVLCL